MRPGRCTALPGPPIGDPEVAPYHPVGSNSFRGRNTTTPPGTRIMDHIRPPAIAIPLETWLAQRDRIMERFGHLRKEDMRFISGREDELIQRLQTLLFMARRAVIDLIHGK